jgi:hypothetical protein
VHTILHIPVDQVLTLCKHCVARHAVVVLHLRLTHSTAAHAYCWVDLAATARADECLSV